MTRVGTVLVAVAAGAALAATPAADAATLPAPTAQELAQSVTPIEGTVLPLELRVEDLETTRTQGRDTVLDLRSDILFGFGKAEISQQAAARIGTLVAKLPRGARVSVEGHTDSIGSDAANLTLSRARAAAVGAAVTAARADLRPSITGYGESRPIAPNTSGSKDDPEGRAKNRRVEIHYTG